MHKEQVITVYNHSALVFEMGIHRDVREWWVRSRSGVTGLEGVRDGGNVLRLELHEGIVVDAEDIFAAE